MSQFKWDDVAAVEVDGQLVCAECLTDSEQSGAELDDILDTKTVESNEDTLYFCDRCKHRL